MAETVKLTPKFELVVGGSPAGQVLIEAVSVIRVHQHLELADALELVISNNELDWTDGETLVEGTELKVKLGYQETSCEQVFSGEIARRDCEFPVEGPALVTVVAYDREHRLKRGRKSRTFIDMKDSDIVKQLAGEAGLSAQIEDSKVKHPYVLQNAQNNLAFIRERAYLMNYEVDVDRENAKITFRPADTSSNVAELEWGENLLSLSPRMAVDEQVSKVVVRGWDMKKKEKIESVVNKSKIDYDLDGQSQGAALAEKAYGEAEVLYTNHPVFVVAEAEAQAAARLNEHALRYCQGTGSCQGDPKIDAGVSVTIKGCGKRANGKHYLYKTLHHFEPSVGYSTQFNFVRSSEKKA